MSHNRMAVHRVARSIVVVREQRVLLDEDLAELYGVEVKALNQAVRRNLARFPVDFAFQLTEAEARFLRSQSVTLEIGRGRHRKYRPWAFTEQGVAMLSSVLRSPRAVAANIQIMRAFVDLRRAAALSAEVLRRIKRLETKYDDRFRQVFAAIRALIQPTAQPRRRIGFKQG